MLLRKTFRFEASHILPKHPGKCSRLHGHSWVLHVFVEGPVSSETGFVMDFADISKHVNPLIEALDHRHLGQWAFAVPNESLMWEIFHEHNAMTSIEPHPWRVPWLHRMFYPSSENLLVALGNKLIEFSWSKLALEETCTSYAELTREEFNATRNKE